MTDTDKSDQCGEWEWEKLQIELESEIDWNLLSFFFCCTVPRWLCAVDLIAVSKNKISIILRLFRFFLPALPVFTIFHFLSAPLFCFFSVCLPIELIELSIEWSELVSRICPLKPRLCVATRYRRRNYKRKITILMQLLLSIYLRKLPLSSLPPTQLCTAKVSFHPWRFSKAFICRIYIRLNSNTAASAQWWWFFFFFKRQTENFHVSFTCCSGSLCDFTITLYSRS